MIPELSRDNPTLKTLEEEYSRLNLFPHSNWQSYQNVIDILNFRGENGFASQTNYGMTPEKYAATYDYVVRLGERDSLVRLGEDSAFGAVTFTSPDGIVYSRDLLDSVMELRFLRETLGLTPNSAFNVLDIGSGYGRFLHRLSQMFPYSFGIGADGVPISTFLCDFYLNYRNVKNAAVVSLGRLSELLPNGTDIACNAYSFAEMPFQAIDFWLSLCHDIGVRYFFLVPHDTNWTDGVTLSHEPDNSHIDYLSRFEHYGFKLIRRVNKYQPREDSQKYVWGTEYLAFKRG